MSFFDSTGNLITDNSIKGVQRVDYSRAIPDGPVDRGFDYFFGTVSCPTTDWIYTYVENDRIPLPPTKILDKSSLPKHPYSRDCRAGMVASNFDHEEVDLVFLEKSKKFIEDHIYNTPDQPFFLFHSMQAVHLPSFPAEQFKGKTDSGPHGDFIFEMDYVVGQLLEKLEKEGVAENTVVIFASDNGPEVLSVIDMRSSYQHDGARPWRGVKRDQWEGGHRTPFIVRWPGKIEPGTISDQLLSLTDIMPTCADLVGQELPPTAAEDGFNMMPAFLNPNLKEMIRPHILQQTIKLELAIRKGNWKYLDHQGSGGNNYEREGAWSMRAYALPDTDPEAPGQLYDLDSDPGETKNLYSLFPDKVRDLKDQLEYFKKIGRSNIK